MRREKSLSIALVAVLLLSLTAVVGFAQNEQHAAWAIWVDPEFTDTLEYCETFTVDVYINASSIPAGDKGLYSWEYKLNWDTTKISCTGCSRHIPTIWGANYVVGTDSGGVGANNHWFGVSGKAPAPPWNETSAPWAGAQSVCTYTFHVEYQPYEPDPDYNGSIWFTIHKLYGYPSGGMIAHTSHNGEYRIHTKPTPLPKFEVMPADIKGEPEGPVGCGELFNVTIEIYNLVSQWNLTGWEAKLEYNTTILDCLNSYEGPFLPSFQGPNGTVYINHINDPLGVVITGGAFLGSHAVASCPGTSGVLAILEFNASAQSIAPELLTCDLGLFATKVKGFVSGAVVDVDHTVNNATYQAPYKILGWGLDCYTDAWRKKPEGYTDYTGKGINATADSYEPQDLVILFAELRYNLEPEANKIVSFEIYGPQRPGSYNVSIIRTAITNKDGIATINFTIPWPCEQAEETIFGHWVCYQAAQVKIYEKPDDWLFWKVGWIIEILDVEVTVPEGQNGVKECQWIEVFIEYKTIAFMDAWVLFTVIAMDELLDPIQEETWWVYVPGTKPVLCSETVYNTTEVSHIPQWAHVGKATVYVNAFTDFPMACGCPYCPEVTETFWILVTADP